MPPTNGGATDLSGGARAVLPYRTDERLSQISTQWSLLFRAHEGPGQDASAAQMELLQRYCGAIYRYLRSAVPQPEIAEDLCQEFALRFVRGDFRRADPDRGRFRDFVKTSLFNLITDYRRQQRARPPAVSYDSSLLAAKSSPGGAADQDFMRLWREELLDRAWESLSKVQDETGQLFYTVLRLRAENPDLRSPAMATRLTEELGRPFTAEGIRQTLHRAREKFAELLLDEVRRSLQTTKRDEVMEELQALELLVYCQPALEKKD